uniref:glutathione transferase n=1 Tax=Oryza brachyantha TaxID=4533 RepID=J3KZY7_ORYBR
MVDVWLEVESAHFDAAMSPIIFQCFIIPMFIGGSPDMGVVSESLEKLKKALQVYEARLAKSRYLAGDFVSLADISHVPTSDSVLPVGVCRCFCAPSLSPCEGLGRWHNAEVECEEGDEASEHAVCLTKTEARESARVQRYVASVCVNISGW